MSRVAKKALLEVKDLAQHFGGLKAIDQVNLTLHEGEIVSVIGPNGAGKTTLLDMICGKTKPTNGTIKFKNYELTGMIEYQLLFTSDMTLRDHGPQSTSAVDSIWKSAPPTS